MPKKDQQQQPNLPPDVREKIDASATPAEAIQAALPFGPFDVTDINGENALGSSGTLIEVQAYDGADAYHVRENDGLIAYRTVQRIDLATRLQLPTDYDPAALVGRTFMVPA